MNKKDAKEIAKKITNDDLVIMFENAKNNIIDWTVRSTVNKSFSKGAAWNFLAKDFNYDFNYHYIAKINLIWEFGDFLEEHLKISHAPKKLPKIVHQDPIF